MMGANKAENIFVGAIDQGTTSTRFIIFDIRGRPVASHQIEFKQIYPQSGWIEHDPNEIFESVEKCIAEATESFTSSGHAISAIKAVGITTQRETTVLWDAETGEIACNAIAWPDTRTQTLVQEFRRHDGAAELQDICGLPLSTYPSSLKLVWMLRNVEKAKKLYEAGRLAFGTVDTWLLYNLNGKMNNVHITDVTNASRTMFVNLHSLEYDRKVFAFFQIDPEKIKFPRIVPSSDFEDFGHFHSGPLKGIRITGCLGDQSAALVGQLSFNPGQAKNTYGTGCFLLYNVGEKPVISKHGLLATVAYQLGKASKPVYALEGSIAVAGSAVKFLQHNMGFIEASHHIGDLAESVEDNGGVVFVTAFSGLFAPYWIDDAKGTLFGLTQHTRRGHIARATLEATCFQTKAILQAMEKDSGRDLKLLAVDGGMSNSDLCMQTQADITGIPVDRPHMRETTSLGAAIVAGLAAGLWKNLADLENVNKEGRTVFQPRMPKSASDAMYKRWERAVEMSRGWLKSDSSSHA